MMLITGSSDLKVFIDLTPSWMPTPTMTAEGGGKIITKRLGSYGTKSKKGMPREDPIPVP